MAAQVLSGSGNVTYTNSTGQNVRVVINYLETSGTGFSNLSFQGVSVQVGQNAKVGKSIPIDRTLPNATVYPRGLLLINWDVRSKAQDGAAVLGWPTSI